MIIMPANASGWFWHSLARETSRLGHLYSPEGQRGPWPWFPYALDNGAFSCWNPGNNTFDDDKWATNEQAWRNLLFWAQVAPIKPRWAIVPDVPGNRERTLKRWADYAPEVALANIPLAVAVQDGMTLDDVWDLDPRPEVICVGGSTEWKWKTVEMWASNSEHCHLLRCNAPDKLDYLESIGIESTDGTGWNRGDRKQTAGLEAWCRKHGHHTKEPLWPHASRAKSRTQMTFA